MRFGRQPKDEFVDVHLPWDLTISVRPGDTIGRSICTYGVYDLATTESIFRLLDPGEAAVDIGANVGYMTGVMARRSGAAGQVICFEPCPSVFGELAVNLARWKSDIGLAEIHANQLAMSRANGEADLQIPVSFDSNHGTASLEADPTSGPSVTTARVKVARLDEILAPTMEIGVVKIDVEGHEFGVLEGAEALLNSHRIRDIIIEEHGVYPTPAQSLLESHGYTLYRLSRTFLRPTLNPCDDSRTWDQHPVGVLANFVATLDPDRAQSRFSVAGWKALSGKFSTSQPLPAGRSRGLVQNAR